MYEWSEEQLAIRDAVRRFVDEEVKPNVEELEHGETPPYEVIRKLYSTFGLDVMARESAKKAIERKAAGASGAPAARAESGTGGGGGSADLMTFDKVGAWAITEPDSGSDALGGMKSTAVRDGDEYVLNGNKTFITNGPFADTIVFYAKLDDGSDTPLRQRPVLTFILDSGMPGLEQSKPFRKMGLHSSPTGELFLSDVRVGRERLLGETEGAPGGQEGRESAKGNFVTERAGVAAMSLGLIEECLKLSIQYAKDRQLWERPISEFQLIQLKLAKMEIARLNVENLVFRHVEMAAAGKSLTLGEASAMKLYSAQAASEVAMEAVQLFGGNGYMSEFRVEQLARDAKVFQIYAGTDEIQVTHIARDLLGR